jgi:MOSC domain-containing protein YiiM
MSDDHLDPDTAVTNPEVLRKVARGHDGTAGVYGAVLAEGVIRVDDPVEVLD